MVKWICTLMIVLAAFGAYFLLRGKEADARSTAGAPAEKAPEIAEADMPEAKACIEKLRALHRFIDLYRKQRNGKPVGDLHEMGLPTNAEAHRMDLEGRIDRRHVGARATGKQLIYAPLPPGKVNTHTWSEYVRLDRKGAILFWCPYHDQGDLSNDTLFAKDKVHTSVGITLDGKIRIERKRGDAFTYSWWLDE